MLIDRKALVAHLGHIRCEGLLPDAVLSGQFISAGASADRQVMVLAGGMPKVDPLAEEVGVTNLELLNKVLESMDDDNINLTVENGFIVVTAHDRTFRLVTAAARVIGTRIDQQLVDRIRALVPDNAPWGNLEHQFVRGVMKAASILKADVMTLSVGPNGSSLGVGEERLNIARFDLPAFKDAQSYELTLPKTVMVPVLTQLTDFTKAQMCLTGPDSVIAIREGTYTYIISPDKPGADAKK